MSRYVALLRAVNVGGTGKLSMAHLVSIASGRGFSDPGTYIQSGNLLFGSDASEVEVRSALEAALAERAGLQTSVLVRTAEQMARVAEANPYPHAEPNRLGVLFLQSDHAEDPLAEAKGLADEEVMAVGREIYVHFPSGMGKSRLKLPAMDKKGGGTMRNLNTVRKLVAMSDPG